MDKGPKKFSPHEVNEDDIYEYIKQAKTVDNFFTVQCLISNLFYKKDSKEINQLIDKKTNFYLHTFEDIVDNVYFLEALRKITEQFQVFKKNYAGGKNFFEDFKKTEIKNKKIVFTALASSTAFLSNVLPSLNEKSLIYTANRLRIPIEKIREKFNYYYSFSEIFFALDSSFQDLPILKFPFEINNLDHLFRQQKISSRLASLIIRLSFRHVRLNSLFKTIERDKSYGKFSSLSLYRIGRFINEERYFEDYYIKKLGSLYKENEFIQYFIENFESDKNKKNAFNLIELTVDTFKNRKTIETDFTNIINKASRIQEEVENYGLNNFKVFRGKITEDDFEWSNKIFVNCSRLFGSLGSISKAIDISWKINAGVREFSDWVGSIHKILNKYDIEDDWEKIAKYLDQETNRVEWKSTFFTPTQINKDDKGYHSTGQNLFYKTVKTLLGMINTEGGAILIGLIENPQEIIVNTIKDNLMVKNNKIFFDVSTELLSSKMNLDVIKRKIQDILKKETSISYDFFNNLWNIQPIIIRSNDGHQEITIYKIEVFKSDKPIFSVRDEEGSNTWVSLIKRADARTIYVDPRRYLTNS